MANYLEILISLYTVLVKKLLPVKVFCRFLIIFYKN